MEKETAQDRDVQPGSRPMGINRIERFVAIVGLPRSGTTVLTALLDAHPAIALYYEPFNSSKQARIGLPQGLTDFCQIMESHFQVPLPPRARTTGFKETTTLAASLDWTIETLARVSAEIPTQVIWIYRNPIHCLLSKVEGARNWWGYPNARFDEETLVAFLHETEPQLAALEDLVLRYRGTIVRYEALAQEPASVLTALLPRLGETFDPSQLDYHKQPRLTEKVMGDPSLIKKPEPVRPTRIAKRAAEEATHRKLIDEVLGRPDFSGIRREFERFDRLPALSGPGIEPS